MAVWMYAGLCNPLFTFKCYFSCNNDMSVSKMFGCIIIPSSVCGLRQFEYYGSIRVLNHSLPIAPDPAFSVALRLCLRCDVNTSSRDNLRSSTVSRVTLWACHDGWVWAAPARGQWRGAGGARHGVDEGARGGARGVWEAGRGAAPGGRGRVRDSRRWGTQLSSLINFRTNLSSFVF